MKRHQAMLILRKSKEYDKLSRLALFVVVCILIMFAVLPLLIVWQKRKPLNSGAINPTQTTVSAPIQQTQSPDHVQLPTSNGLQSSELLNKTINTAFSDILKDVENTNLL